MALAIDAHSPGSTGPSGRSTGLAGVRVSPLAAAEVASAATLAVRALADESRLAQLGEAFVHAFFRASLSQVDTCAARAVDAAGQTVGYALASADVHAFRRHVQPRIALRLVRALLNPGRIHLAPNFLRGLREAEPQPAIAAELLLLYVDPQHKREGVGRELLTWLESGFKARDIRRYRVAVRSQLGEAKAFYQAVGFVFEQELPTLGEPMTYFVREL